MESSYGIGVKNRYAIFIGDEQEDPLDLVSKTGEKPIKTDKTADKKSVKALNDSKISSANQQNIIKDKTQKDSIHKSKTTESQSLSKAKDIAPKGDANRPPRQKTDRNQRNVTRDHIQTDRQSNQTNDRSNRPPRPSGDQKDIDDLKNQRNREERFGHPRERRENRNDGERRGGERGGRVGGERRRGKSFNEDGNANRRGKRDLDRHSGSDKAGVKAVDKREGGGAHNWGKIDDFGAIPLAADSTEIDRSADETQLDVNDSNQENDANLSEDQKEVIEGPKEMTLEEYKQQLEEKRVAPKFNLRKPGEGEDNTQWKKTFVLKKKVEDEEEVEYEEIEVEEERKGRHKQFLDIEINFRDEGRDFPRRGDGRRGGRGRDRGDRTERSERGGGGGGGTGGGERRERREGGEGRDRDKGGATRGGPRSDRPFGDRNRTRRPPKEQAAPKVDDFNDFPSLAAA